MHKYQSSAALHLLTTFAAVWAECRMEISFWDVLTTFFLSSRGQLNCGLVHNENDGSFGWLALQPIWKPDWRGRGGNLHLPLVALTHHRFRPKEFSPPISDDHHLHHLNIGAASAIPWPFHPASATPNQFINNHEGRSLRMTRVGCSGIPSYYLKTLSGVLSSVCVSSLVSDEWKVWRSVAKEVRFGKCFLILIWKRK